jgi:hypothetical protein
MPSDCHVKTSINASYADVFRAVEIAASQVGQNIESSDKSKGLILTTRVEKRLWGGLNFHKHYEGRFFYAITVKELEAKTTELAVIAKVQILNVYGGSDCDSYTKLHFATGPSADMTGISQLINFTRNNLIAAGAL